MAIILVTELEAANNFGSLIDRVRQGAEVVIHDGQTEVARMMPPNAVEREYDPEYDAMILARLDQSLADPRPPLDGEAVEEYFAGRRQASQGNALRRAG